MTGGGALAHMQLKLFLDTTVCRYSRGKRAGSTGLSGRGMAKRRRRADFRPVSPIHVSLF
jgi:hypothetical protein